MHIHTAPDPRKDRRVDAVEAVRFAQTAGMRGLVLKCTYYPTTPVAAAVQHVAPEVKVFGSVALDYEAGGLNPLIVKMQALIGAKVLWMPAMSAIPTRKHAGHNDGLAVLDSHGAVLPVVTEILKIVKEHNMVLASGHISFAETLAVFTEAKRLGITKLIATHPLTDIWPPMTMDEMKKLISMGAYVEHCFLNLEPLMGCSTAAKFKEAIKVLGAEHTIMTTDMSQVTDPPPAEGMRMFIATMLQVGITEAEVEFMVKTNPAKLLDLV